MNIFHKLLGASVALAALAAPACGQVTVVNMIPNFMSGEEHVDNQPNLAVNPANPQHIAGTAFTDDLLGGPYAPIYRSIDNGNSWTVTTVMPIGDIRDQTIRFGTQTNILYGSIVGPPPNWELNVVRTRDLLSTSPMTVIDCNNASVPCLRYTMLQPYIEAVSAPPMAEPPSFTPCDPSVTTCPPPGGVCDPSVTACPPGPGAGVGSVPGGVTITPGAGTSGTITDRVYVGIFDASKARGASVYRALNASLDPVPVPFVLLNPIDVRPQCIADGYPQWTETPSVRTAVHSSGVVYALFLRYTDCSRLEMRGDVVVVRDDNWGAGTNTFQALKEPTTGGGDGLAGVRVVRDTATNEQRFPWATASFDMQPVGTNISIAVDPNNSQRVFISWFEIHCGGYLSDGTTCSYNDFVLHARRSLDGGQTWSDDLKTFYDSTNPSLAINSEGAVGLLRQSNVGWWPNAKWEAHFVYTTDDFTTVDEYKLHSASPNDIPINSIGLVGWYNHLMSVGKTFYGIFSAPNQPYEENFPYGVKYQRNVDWEGRTLLAMNNTTPVNASVDPFFFRWEGPVNLNKCVKSPLLCLGVPTLFKNRIRLYCKEFGCILKDVVPKNCTIKYKCPGCEFKGMCPPYYNFHFEGLGKAWDVSLFDSKNRPIKHGKYKTKNGTVITFRPDKQNYRDGAIGDYFLAFEMLEAGKPGVAYNIKASLTRTNGPYHPPRGK